jgi:prepilin-type N-terminal cleavage/methylation domain-containing protein
MTRAGQQHGFTLIELLVVMAIATVVFGATLTALDAFQSNDRLDQLRNEAQDSARNAIDRLARDFRNVAAPRSVPEVPGALEQAGPYSLTFQTIDASSQVVKGKNTTGAMRVRYCLQKEGTVEVSGKSIKAEPRNEILWRQVKKWETEGAPTVPSATACPDLTAGDWESSAQLVRYITNENGGQNRPLFVYGPKGATEVSQIISVEPTLYIDVNPGHPHPGETQLTSAISLRNANRQPIAAFTWKQESLKRLLLNASGSEDPNGLALSYKWTDTFGGTEKTLPSTAQVWETEELQAGTHTIALEVADPGGLTASEKHEVTVK